MNNDTNNANENLVGNVMDAPNPSPTPVMDTPAPTVAPVGGVVTPEVGPIIEPTPEPSQVVTPVESQVITPESQVMDTVVTPSVEASPIGEASQPMGSEVVMEAPNPNPTPVMDTPATPVVEPAPVMDNGMNTIPAPSTEPVMAPMPGFEDPNVVGTIPPQTVEAEKKPDKPKNKIAFIILIVVVLLAIGGGTFYLLKYTDLFKSSAQVTITTKKVSVEVGAELSSDINDYATIKGTESKNCNLDTADVDTSATRNYQFTVTCGDTKKIGVLEVTGSGSSSGSLNIRTKEVYKVKGETVDVNEFIEETNSEYTYSFTDENTIKDITNQDAGSYDVSISVTKGETTNEIIGKLVIFEYNLKGFYVCSSNPQSVENSSAQLTVSNKFAIVDDPSNPNGFGKVAYESYKYVFTDETEYNEYKNTYKSNGTITINNTIGTPTFEDSSNTITIDNYIDYNSVVSEYGEQNISNYRTIQSHFVNNLGYVCEFKRSE